MMELRDCIPLMLGSDFKDRARAEYWELKIRCEKLEAMCKKYAAGELNFTPNCSLELLQEQLGYMQKYLSILELRAEIEAFSLEEPIVKDGKFYITLWGDAKVYGVSAKGDNRALVKALMIELGRQIEAHKSDDVNEEEMIKDLVGCICTAMMAERAEKAR